MRKVFESVEIRIINEPIEKPVRGRITIWLGLFKSIFKERTKRMNLQKIRKNRIEKTLVSFLVLVFLLVQGIFPLVVAAQAAPSAPSAPTAPTPEPDPEATITPPAEPTPQAEPTPPQAPFAPSAPTVKEASDPKPTPTPTQNNESSTRNSSSPSNSSSNTSSGSTSSGGSTSSQPSTWTGSGNQTQNGQSGSTIISTGDANNVGNISTSANTNISGSPTSSGSGGGIKVVNSENGTNSENNGSANLKQDTNTIQDNDVNVGNNLYQKTITGDNSASKNTGGNNVIITGDASTSGTILTGVNTNLDGVSIYEFNIVDDHTGDYVLDFSSANCISGCTPGSVSVINTGNGAGSINTGDVDTNVNDATFQTNDATVENNMFLASNSGENEADKNTGGDSTIQTGDTNVSGNVVNMVNNNIVGNVVLAVVNIFGNLIGDIILPDGSVLSCCAPAVTTANTGNGADSTNTTSVDQTTNSNTYQFNNVDIQNNIVLDAQTGGNDVSKNTSGDNSVTTGDANIVGQVLNIANTNLVGGNWWLVLVNEAGRWIGKIIGADGSNYAGSDGFEFIVDENGEITVLNSGNGAGSTNTGTLSQITNTTTVQNNDAQIVNNVNLSANSGGNSATKNTGGNSTITTGDANIVANIVNFVNNNIVGGRKLFVTIINVFGSWLGDFVGPGQAKENDNGVNIGIGGASNSQPNNESSNSNSTNSSEGGDSSTSTAGVIGTTALKVSTTRKVLGLFASAQVSNDDDPQVAMANDGDQSQTAATKKVVRINLAWLMLLLPIGAAYIIRKRRLVLNTSVRKV